MDLDGVDGLKASCPRTAEGPEVASTSRAHAIKPGSFLFPGIKHGATTDGQTVLQLLLTATHQVHALQSVSWDATPIRLRRE